MSTVSKRCKQCGHVYTGDDVSKAFRIYDKRLASARSPKLHYSRDVCRACEQDLRINERQKARWRTKVSGTRLRHAKSLGISVYDLEKKYNWDISIMAHEAEHNYTNGCSECHYPYSGMANGLHDITLDIWDKRVEPFYGSNTRWICNTCNQEKGAMSPEEWAIYKRLRRERDETIKNAQKVIQLGLFQL